MKLSVKILNPHRDTGWIDLVVNDRWVQAKVYDERSTYGVRDCRVSKLSVAKYGVRLLGIESGLNFFENLDYHYDRGLDFHNEDLSQKELDSILDYLNDLPKFFEDDG